MIQVAVDVFRMGMKRSIAIFETNRDAGKNNVAHRPSANRTIGAIRD